MENEKKLIDRNIILEELRSEEETENHLIWLYQTLIDLGVENCLPENKKEFFRSSIKKLKDDSNSHKVMIKSVLDKYQN